MTHDSFIHLRRWHFNGGIAALHEAAGGIGHEGAEYELGIGGPDLARLNVLADDRGDFGILIGGEKGSANISIELPNLGGLCWNHVAIRSFGGGAHGVVEGGWKGDSKILLDIRYCGMKTAILLVVGALAFRHFCHGPERRLLIRTRRLLSLHRWSNDRADPASQAKGNDNPRGKEGLGCVHDGLGFAMG